MIRHKFHHPSDEFLNLLCSYPDLVATLKEAKIPFESLGGLEKLVYERLHQIFQEVEIAIIRQVAQLVYIAGEDLGWLHLDVHTTAAFAFYESDDMICTIHFKLEEQLKKLFHHTQLKRFTERIPETVVPFVIIPFFDQSRILIIFHYCSKMTLFAGRNGPIGGESSFDIQPLQGDKFKLGRSSYMYLELVKCHRPMLLFLQQKYKVSDLNDADIGNHTIAKLQKMFPTIDKVCPACGMSVSKYDQHLKDLVSIHKIGGENLQNIWLSHDARRFQYREKHGGLWLDIIQASHLRQIAGFDS